MLNSNLVNIGNSRAVDLRPGRPHFLLLRNEPAAQQIVAGGQGGGRTQIPAYLEGLFSTVFQTPIHLKEVHVFLGGHLFLARPADRQLPVRGRTQPGDLRQHLQLRVVGLPVLHAPLADDQARAAGRGSTMTILDTMSITLNQIYVLIYSLHCYISVL